MKTKLLTSLFTTFALGLSVVGCKHDNSSKPSTPSSEQPSNSDQSTDGKTTSSDPSKPSTSNDSTTPGSQDIDPSDPLASAKEKAIDDLSTFKPESGKDTACGKTNLGKWDATDDYNTAVSEINAATSQDEINAAVSKYQNAIKAKLCAYKKNGIVKAINALTADGLTDSELQAIKDEYIAKVNALTDTEPADIQTKASSYLQDCKDAIAKALSDKKAAEELAKLNKAKEDAHNHVNGVDKTLYRDAEQAQLKTLQDSANASINNAQTEEEIQQAISTFDTEVSKLKLKSKYEEEERQAAEELLNTQKDDAKTEVEGYKNKSDYRPAQQTELQNLIDKTKSDITTAANKDAIDAIVAQFKLDADNIKTDAQLTAEEATQGWDAFVQGKKDEINNYATLSNYDTEEQNQINNLITEYIGYLEALTSDSQANRQTATDKVNLFHTAVDAILTSAQKALNAAKQTAKNSLDTQASSITGYDTYIQSTGAQTAVDAEKTKAEQAIDAAQDQAGIDAAVDAFKDAITALIADYNKSIQLTNDRNSAIQTITDYDSDIITSLSSENQTSASGYLSEYTTKINAASDKTAIDALVEEYKTKVDKLFNSAISMDFTAEENSFGNYGTTTSPKTVSGVGIGVNNDVGTYSDNNVKKLQFRSGSGYIYNTTAIPGGITKIIITGSCGTSSKPADFYVSLGTSILGTERVTSNAHMEKDSNSFTYTLIDETPVVDYNYFNISTGNGTGRIEQLEIFYNSKENTRAMLTAKNTALDTLRDYKTTECDALSTSDKALADTARADGVSAINSSTTPLEVTFALNAAKAAIDAVLALPDQRTAATTEINGYRTEDYTASDFDATKLSQITTERDRVLGLIASATSKDDIDTLVDNYKVFVDGVINPESIVETNAITFVPKKADGSAISESASLSTATFATACSWETPTSDYAITCTEATKIFGGTDSIKMASNKADGKLVFNIKNTSDDSEKKFTKVVLHVQKIGASAIRINTISHTLSNTEYVDVEQTFTAATNELTIDATSGNTLRINKITFTFE